VLLLTLLLCGPLLLAGSGRLWLAALLLLLLAALCHDLLRQPWLGCSLAWRQGEWWWFEAGEGAPLRVVVVRSVLTSPLATCIRLRDPASGRCWWLNLFHDSVPRETLSGLRRRLVVQG
jgi:hypothetical protein